MPYLWLADRGKWLEGEGMNDMVVYSVGADKIGILVPLFHYLKTEEIAGLN